LVWGVRRYRHHEGLWVFRLEVGKWIVVNIVHFF
jgi:hypothetical protein